MTTDQLDVALFGAAAVLLVAIAAVRLSAGTRLPTLLIYLAIGVLLGEDVLGLRFDDPQLAQQIGYAALVVILAEGGLTTRWERIRGAVPAAAVLATVGVAVSVLVTAAAAHAVLGLGWRAALLAGAVVASTDAAAVFSLLRQVPLPGRLSGILEAESGFNDAPVVILVVALSTGAAGPAWQLSTLVVVELAIGAAVGLLVGWLGAELVRRIALPATGLYPIAITALAVLAYGAAAVLHGSGFLAVYLAGVVLGNSRLPHRVATQSFIEGSAWLAQIGLFVMLGLLADPSRLGRAVLPAIVIGLVLLLVSRPLSVLVSTAAFRLPWREQAFLSWAGLRGAVPIVMATVPMVAGSAEGDRLFDLVFVLVVVFTLVQAPTLPWVSNRLGVAESEMTRDLDVDALPLEKIGAEVLHLAVPPTSELHGVEIFELRLPPRAVVTLVIRDGRAFVPDSRTALQHGDEVLLVVPADLRAAVEHRLTAVSRAGRLAGWFGELGEPESPAPNRARRWWQRNRPRPSQGGH